MKILWFFPTHGDGHYLGTAHGARAVDLPYLEQIAIAADRLGFHGALLPTGSSCEEGWVTAASLISVTKRLRFLVAMRPGLISPTLAARTVATFDRLSQGRALVNVVTGGDSAELAGDGMFASHDERYEITDEFLHIWRSLLSNPEPLDYQGKHLRVEGSRVLLPAVQRPHPALYFGGSSPAGIEIAARHVDHYLTWGEPPAAVAQKIAIARAAAAAVGRTLRFGIRLHVIVRRTSEEAWAEAERLISRVDDHSVRAAQAMLARHDSVGQQRMNALQKGAGRSRADLEISPNLWAGVGLVRGGAGTALVGSAEEVAARILEYRDLGIESFIFSGYPHLEEAWRVAELLFPLLPLSHEDDVLPAPAKVAPTGEIMASGIVPSAFDNARSASVSSKNPVTHPASAAAVSAAVS